MTPVPFKSFEELTGTRVEVIHIVGGGSQNDALNQLTANACGRPVIAGPVEATILGNVLIQARSAGQLSTLTDIRSVVRESIALKTFEPKEVGPWNDAYPRFVALCARSAGTSVI
jgi:rhamnulokinase